MATYIRKLHGKVLDLPVKGLDNVPNFIELGADLNVSTVTKTYLDGLKSGRIATIDANGFIDLCDGATQTPVGTIVQGFGGFDGNFANAQGSRAIGVEFDARLFVTDQIDTTATFAIGDKLYAGTGAKIGLFVKVAPSATAEVVGIALSAASSASPELTVLVK